MVDKQSTVDNDKGNPEALQMLYGNLIVENGTFDILES